MCISISMDCMVESYVLCKKTIKFNCHAFWHQLQTEHQVQHEQVHNHDYDIMNLKLNVALLWLCGYQKISTLPCIDNIDLSIRPILAVFVSMLFEVIYNNRNLLFYLQETIIPYAYINGMLVILEYGIIANDLVLCYQLRYIFNKWHKICIFMYTYIYMYIYMCV